MYTQRSYNRSYNIHILYIHIIYRFPGFNADMIEVNGDNTLEEDYAKAINGVQAIILCNNFSPTTDRIQQEQEYQNAVNIINIAIKARQAKVGSIKKIVMLSRYIPEYLLSSPDSLTKTLIKTQVDSDTYNGFRLNHEKLERIVRNAKFEYVIVRAPPYVIESSVPSVEPLTTIAAREQVSGSLTRTTGVYTFI